MGKAVSMLQIGNMPAGGVKKVSKKTKKKKKGKAMFSGSFGNGGK